MRSSASRGPRTIGGGARGPRVRGWHPRRRPVQGADERQVVLDTAERPVRGSVISPRRRSTPRSSTKRRISARRARCIAPGRPRAKCASGATRRGIRRMPSPARGHATESDLIVRHHQAERARALSLLLTLRDPDLFSRCVVGWMVAARERAQLAERLIGAMCQKQGITPHQLTIHADRGARMRSKVVAELFTDLARDLSRSLRMVQRCASSQWPAVSDTGRRALRPRRGDPRGPASHAPGGVRGSSRAPSSRDHRCSKHLRTPSGSMRQQKRLARCPRNEDGHVGRPAMG